MWVGWSGDKSRSVSCPSASINMWSGFGFQVGISPSGIHFTDTAGFERGRCALTCMNMSHMCQKPILLLVLFGDSQLAARICRLCHILSLIPKFPCFVLKSGPRGFLEHPLDWLLMRWKLALSWGPPPLICAALSSSLPLEWGTNKNFQLLVSLIRKRSAMTTKRC